MFYQLTPPTNEQEKAAEAKEAKIDALLAANDGIQEFHLNCQVEYGTAWVDFEGEGENVEYYTTLKFSFMPEVVYMTYDQKTKKFRFRLYVNAKKNTVNYTEEIRYPEKEANAYLSGLVRVTFFRHQNA